MNEEFLVDARMRALRMLSGPTIHELRGAANVLALHLQLLAVEPTDDAAIERRRRSLAAADDGRRRLFDIAETFVRHAALDASRVEFDLAHVADEAVALARPYAVQRRVAVTITPSGAPATVFGRRDVVVQVLVELLLDLLDRSPAGSTFDVAVDTNGDRARVALRGNGSEAMPDATLLGRAEAAMRWAGGALRGGDGEVTVQLPIAPPGDSHES